MARRSYNGFSGRKRSEVARWVREVGRPSGLVPAIRTYCQGCHRSNREIKGHNEDYNRPETFWSVCKPCHMWIHRRFSDWAGFVEYCKRLPNDSVLRTLPREEPNYENSGTLWEAS